MARGIRQVAEELHAKRIAGPPDTPDTALVGLTLPVLQALGDLVGAKAAFERALDIRRR